MNRVLRVRVGGFSGSIGGASRRKTGGCLGVSTGIPVEGASARSTDSLGR